MSAGVRDSFALSRAAPFRVYGASAPPPGMTKGRDGIREEVTLRAVKSVIALQLQQAIADQKITRPS